MYIHEIHYKQTLDHHEKLRREAQNYRLTKHTKLRQSLARALYTLAEKLEPTNKPRNLLRS